MSIITTDPSNSIILHQYETFSEQKINSLIAQANDAFYNWKGVSIGKRSRILKQCASLLLEDLDSLAELISKEMGKTVSEAKAEIRKCSDTCVYYADNTPEFLKEKLIESDANESYVSYEPLGVILAIMPWNFPFWQFFRFAAPALMLGNSILLKHASNVTGCSLAIEALLQKAGFPNKIMSSLVIDSEDVESIVDDKRVKAITLTGSEKAGGVVASIAGRNIKKCVLELGGSDPFIVLNDADISIAVDVGFKSRMLNGGQSCIAAKRFIIEGEVYHNYLKKFVDKVADMKIDSNDEDGISIVPIAKESILIELLDIIEDAIHKGAKLHIGGSRIEKEGNWIEPTVISDVTPEMRAYTEELFGPIAVFYKVEDESQAILQANDSSFGLGATVFTKDINKAKRMSREINTGAVFINSLVKSDPRLPFGGVNKSGYGRELSREGMLEFANIKTVSIS